MKSLIAFALLCLLGLAALAQDRGGPPPGGGPAGPEATSPREKAVVAQQDSGSAASPQQSGNSGTAQGPERGEGRGRGGMGRGVMGEITAVNADGFAIKTMQGNSATVKVSSETKFMRNREEIKRTDLKVGDSIGVAGQPDANDPTTWNANFVIDRTAQVKEFKENLGKTVIAGEVKAIEETKLTILRPDGQTQTIEADENTSFKKGRDSVTLADIKVGDRVMGRGAVKNGVFIPTELRVGGPGGMGMGMMDGARDRGPEGNQQPK